MVQVVKRPESCILSATPNTSYSLTNLGGITTKVTLSGGSGLADGDKILIVDSFDSYNGFAVVKDNGAPDIYLHRYIGDPAIDIFTPALIDYTQSDSNVKIYKCDTEVDWSCVHLPIVYTLASDLSPNVSGSFPNTSITSFQNDNGFLRILISSNPGTDVLDFLKISGSTVTALNAIFQVLTKNAANDYTLNVPYSLATVGSLSSASARRYFNNYAVLVRIYGGLPSGHRWEALKPYTFITELKLPTDPNGNLQVNISEALKQQIQISRNRPNYDSMPFDLDRFCSFYIEYAETYEDAGDVYISSYTSDLGNLEGFAADAKLEFKNRFSGFLSAYTGDGSNLAKFLTDAITPRLFPNNYFDLSFIKPDGLNLSLSSANYDSYNNLIGSSNTNISETDEGIVRIPISRDTTETTKIIRVVQNNTISAPESNNTSTIPGRWTRETSPSPGTIFSVTSDSWTAHVTGYSFIYFYTFLNTIPAGSVIPSFVVTVQYPNSAFSYEIKFLGAGGQVVATGSIGLSGAGTLNITTSSYTAAGAITGLRIFVSGINSPIGDITVNISDLLNTSFPYAYFTESLTLDVDTDCYDQYIYLTWKNPLGGFNYWLFTGNKDYSIAIEGTKEKDINLIPSWDRSYGEFADTVTYETSRDSHREIVVRSQNLSKDQANFISGVKTSSLVQQMTSKYDRRTMIVDKSSFKIRGDQDKNAITIEFTIRETNDIATQSL